MENKKARIIAFYLPQFHPIPENNKWWGKGFTEWTNVGKAIPLFKGHYQPRVPADLGYYDLRMPEVREAQAEMAREAGIEGFMYWHYWFGNGKMVLERPFKEVLKSGKPDFPFALGWANHLWRTHDWNPTSLEHKEAIIAEQLYPGEKDYTDHFFYVLDAFKDKRYLTIDGKPIFYIFDPTASPEISKFISLWRKLALENGLPGIHFIGRSHGWLSKNKVILDVGVDSVNSVGEWRAESIVSGKWLNMLRHTIVEKFGGLILKKYSYKEISKYLFTKEDEAENIYPSIVPQWDRSPRSGRKAIIYYGSTPELFGQHLEDALNRIKNKQDEHKIIFLKSWNEWGEGNYVEPDLKFGKGYLNEIKKRVLTNHDEQL
ncbi:glycoside hydrolase family 99-like domain-containing protein [Methylobacter sp. S3L5C]|uniref:glycosyltransferase WbsX family protein n=1 Tax=Methylobacter sp. S3L5C TaxID=2839024 RepID=UPI001FABF68B|nr:glycoside hydrolase family 99-like domain-containing protein [Methylobacter sp. S3L5C]UOA08278.1 glycoside hydrolase family 99-like domain-containing protein [Methylobacter sp. S3L5C]